MHSLRLLGRSLVMVLVNVLQSDGDVFTELARQIACDGVG